MTPAAVVVLAALSAGGAGRVDAVAPPPAADDAAAAIAFKVVTSAHFVVHTDAAAAVYQPLLARLEDVHQALRESLFVGVPLPRVAVLLLARRGDFEALAPAGLVGFFKADVPGFEARFPDGVIVLPADGGEACATTAAHELLHAFMQALSDRVPTWLHEGLAKVVGGLRVERTRRITFDAAPVSVAWAQAAPPLPLARLFAAGPSDFHGASARTQYLTAWLLARELTAAVARGNRAGLPRRFQALVAQTVLARDADAQAAVVARAAGTSIATLEQRVHTAHAALRAGATPAVPRRLTVRLGRAPRAKLHVAADDPAFVTALRAALIAPAQ
jgi:hypothetical protein